MTFRQQQQARKRELVYSMLDKEPDLKIEVIAQRAGIANATAGILRRLWRAGVRR